MQKFSCVCLPSTSPRRFWFCDLKLPFITVGFTVFLQTFTGIPALENKLGVVLFSEAPFPNAGLSGTNFEHDHWVKKSLPIQSLRGVSAHKPRSAVTRFGISSPWASFLSPTVLLHGLSFYLCLMIYCHFLSLISSFLFL